MEDPFVFKVLDISTGHMEQRDAELLDKWHSSGSLLIPPTYVLAEYGYLVYCRGPREAETNELSQAVQTILAWARSLGCDYVRFDRDGRQYDGLPIFDW